MRPGSGYLPVEIRYPLKGINADIPSTQVPMGYSPLIHNRIIRNGVTKNRSGYYELTDQVLDGEIQAIIDFELLNQTRILVALTTTRQYSFNEGSDLWVDRTPLGTDYAITVVDQGTDTFTIAGDHTAEFPTGSIIRVTGSTGNDGEYVVDTSVLDTGNTEITVEEEIPNATADGDIQRVFVLTTPDDHNIEWVIGTDDDSHYLYMTNGSDLVRIWDGVTTTFEIWAPNFPGFISCKTLAVFFDHLILGGLQTATEEPKTVAWSDTTDFDEFVAGNSGVMLIPSIQGEIQTMKNLADRLIVYSNDTIAGLIFLGTPTMFGHEVFVQQTRLVSARGIVNFGPAHLFISQENIYFFDGTKLLRPVGNEIRPLYKQDLNPEFGSRLFTFNDVVKQTIFIVVPFDADSGITYFLDYNIYDLNKFIWTRNQFTDRLTAMGFYLRRETPSWIDPPDVSWDEDLGIWDDASEEVNFPVRMTAANGLVYFMDETVLTDDGITPTSFYDTPDFVVPEADLSLLGRWGEIEADLNGKPLQVLYSTDKGSNFTSISAIPANNGFQRVSVPLDVVAQTIRFRFSSSRYFELRWVRAWVRPNGPR